MAAAAYGAKIMKDLDLIPEGYKIMVIGSVQEEDLSLIHIYRRAVSADPAAAADRAK